MSDDTISGGSDNSNNVPAETPATAPQETTNSQPTDTPANVTPEPGAAAAEMTPEPLATSAVPQIPSENTGTLNTPNIDGPAKLALDITGNVQIAGQVDPTKTLRQVLADGGINNPENYTFRNSAGHLVAMDKPLSETRSTTIKALTKTGGG